MFSKQSLLTCLGIGVSAVFLWLSLRGTNFQEIGAALQQSRLWLALPFLLALFVFYWIKTWRWSILLAPLRHITTRSLFPPVMIGYGSNAILPMQLGELLRTYLVSKRFQLGITPVLASIALERMFDLMMVLLILGAALMFGTELSPILVNTGYFVATLASAILIASIAYVLWTEKFVAVFDRLTRFLPGKLQTRLVQQVKTGSGGLQAIKSVPLLSGIFATSIIMWGFMWLCVYVSLLALDIDCPPSAVFMVLLLTVVGVTLPTSPGYIGTIQLAYTLALKPYGVSAGQAFAASVFYHVLAYVSVVIVGLFFLRHLGYSVHQVRSEAESAAQESG